MELLLIVIAAFTFAYLIFTLIEFFIGFNQIKNLSQQRLVERNKLPSVSIIVSALNEEAEIEAALLSMLNMRYPNLEVIAINDRSTDKTPEILTRLQQSYSNLRVFHISHLPEGWFGKNHALYFGSQQATGEWLLFTDADVLMKPDSLSKAISYVLENKLDHLTICEHHLPKSMGLKILLLANYVSYTMAFKPWRIRYSWSKKSLGHGAFNLVNKNAYQQCGGHCAIATECLDDVKLGTLIKQNGYKQDTVNGRDYIEREWYTSLKNMIEGLKKNAFAYFDYQLLPLLRDTVLASIFYLWPLFAPFFLNGAVRWLNIVNICLMFCIAAYIAKQFRLQKYYAFFYPIGIVILLYTLWKSATAVYMNKGVVWRGTYYPLKELKKNRYPDNGLAAFQESEDIEKALNKNNLCN